jgi:hypothetical protein
MSVKKWYSAALIVLSLIFYFLLAQTNRQETTQLFLLFGFLFLIYLFVIKMKEVDLKWWLLASVLFRLQFLFFLPLLSDDFYRFIWDGRLMATGYHPFSQLPAFYMQHGLAIPGITQSLFEKLNSPEYFTIYPPVNQFVFWLSAKLFPDSIFGSAAVMRLCLIAADIGSVYFIRKLLIHHQLPARNILIYALNPLVIIELSGNLHFEALMIFFIVVSFWLFIRRKNLQSAVAFGFAIATKLLPLIALPLFINWLGWRKALFYFLAVGACCLLVFLPILNLDFISGFSQSLGYYFKKFEFNASIYYLVREYGFWKYGYNIIQTAGLKLGLWSAMLIFVYTILHGELNDQGSANNRTNASVWSALLFVFVIYFLFSTTVHPWYITTLVAFSVFTNWRFAVVWSGLIFLTYAGYYSNGFSENYYLTAIEYTAVLMYFFYEAYQYIRSSRQNSLHHLT